MKDIRFKIAVDTDLTKDQPIGQVVVSTSDMINYCVDHCETSTLLKLIKNRLLTNVSNSPDHREHQRDLKQFLNALKDIE